MRIAIRQSFWKYELSLSIQDIEKLIERAVLAGDVREAFRLLLTRTLALGITTPDQFDSIRIFPVLMKGRYPYYLIFNPLRSSRVDVSKPLQLAWDPTVLVTNPDILNPQSLKERWPNKMFIEVTLGNGRKYYLSYNDYPWAFNSGLFIYEHRVPINNETWQFEDMLMLAQIMEGNILSLNDPHVGASRPERLHIQFFNEDQSPFNGAMRPFEDIMIKKLAVSKVLGNFKGVEIEKLDHLVPVYRVRTNNIDVLIDLYNKFNNLWITDENRLIRGFEVIVQYENGQWTVYYFPRSREQYVPRYKNCLASSNEYLGFLVIDYPERLDELETDPQQVFDNVYSKMILDESSVADLERNLFR